MLLGVVLAGSSEPVQAAEYTWPAYSPTVAYDFAEDYGILPMPTQLCPDGVYDDYTGDPVSTYIDSWWCFRWGSDANPAVSENAWIPMLERFNDDFNYITNVMGWPRDSRARDGYYSTIYLYGSGLSTDNASNTDTGGWQGMAGGYPMVLASYVPVISFDPATYNAYQTGAMIHEGIHCILSSMPGCFNSCWFHEGGNTWLQGTMEAQRSGSFTGMGWLSAGSVIAPFMPIECYSGWLQDGSFGGPCAQGVYQGDGICTWRNLLGGVQYSEAFPHAMEVILGPKSVAWVWRNAEYSGRVLQDLAEAPGGLGEAQVRRLIREYRGRQAFCDLGLWSYAYRQLLHNNWGAAIEEESSPYWINVDPWYATCYVATTQNGGTLTPASLTLPGWSGANQIPLTVDPGAAEASVTFNPIGANMSCQLVYRDTGGDVHYGVPVSSGTCSVPLANVMNNVVIAVVCNTDYIYVDDTTRTTKYDYTLTMGAGVTGTADIYTKWFDYNPASYTVAASAAANGSISPSGNIVVSAGASQTFYFTPGSGYEVDEVILNGFEIGPMSSYTLNNIRGDCTMGVTFKLLGSDGDPPVPNPSTWASVPTAAGTDSITMTATTASDAGGVVEYYFRETTGNPGGGDSGWQSSPTYTDTGLSGSTEYTYQVRTRDAYDNRGVWSVLHSAFTQFSGVANIALLASVTTSYVSPWETLEAVNDGYTPANSADYTHGAYGNWDGTSNTWNWVEYDFGAIYQVNSTDVYWWADGGGIVQPYDAYIEYWNGSTWVSAGSIGTALDQWNTLVTNVTTSKLRISMVSTISTGILEWQVWGEVPGGGDTTPPAAPTGLAAVAGDGSVSLDWADNGESDLAGYNVYRDTATGGPYTQIAADVTTSDYVDNTAVNGTTYYYVVTAVDTSSNESAAGAEVAATPQAPSTPEMYVQDITMSSRKAGRNYFGEATVWIKDTSGADVSGATVYGAWSGSTSGSVSGVTGTNGKVLLSSSAVKNGGTFTFTVTDVIKSGEVYNSTLNVESSDTITAP